MLILQRASADEVQELATKEGMLTMRQDGWLKICMGLTTFDEVARQTPADPKFGQAQAVAAMEPVAVSSAPAPRPTETPVVRENEHIAPGEAAKRASASPPPDSFDDLATFADYS